MGTIPTALPADVTDGLPAYLVLEIEEALAYGDGFTLFGLQAAVRLLAGHEAEDRLFRAVCTLLALPYSEDVSWDGDEGAGDERPEAPDAPDFCPAFDVPVNADGTCDCCGGMGAGL